MPLTYTGRHVKPDGATHPSQIDIAVGLSRQPRFAGQGSRWFSVLDHSLFCDELVKRAPFMWAAFGDTEEEAQRGWRLAMLLHDAHEAITADVPTDFKTPALKGYQSSLDSHIFTAFSPWVRFKAGWEEEVKHIDRRALVAEAQVVGPPVAKERILEAFGATDDMYDDSVLLEELLLRPEFGTTPHKWNQESHPGVQEYLKRLQELI